MKPKNNNNNNKEVGVVLHNSHIKLNTVQNLMIAAVIVYGNFSIVTAWLEL